jgi:BirA family transcriptional regulator, biotin operon repressor / biotin---[acetyl-CoA-carboxylase] ligase
MTFDVNILNVETFLSHVELHDTLDSTNNRAKELARDTNIELPALVIARHQTAGRGRGTNKWISTDGALTFSVLIEPASHGIAAASWPQLSLATAVAVCDALELQIEENNPKSEIRDPKSVPRPGIKWPNDVILAGRKIAGILIESPGGAAPAKNRLVIGIGINVNNSMQNASRHVFASAAALCDVTTRQHDLQVVLAEVIRALERRLMQLAETDAQLSHAWQQLSWMPAELIVAESDNHTISGRFAGVADDGALLIETPSGTERVYSATVRPRS